MKDFWKMLLAVICGLILFTFIAIFIISGAASAAGAAGAGKKVLPRSGVLAIDMSSFMLTEQAAPDAGLGGISLAGGVGVPSVGMLQATRALKAAAEDPGVKFIYLKTDGNLSSLASLEEFRKALSDFRRSGKPVIAYIESPGTGSYWLASVADKVYMTEYQGATITMNGVSMQSIFMKDLLDKLGVNVQLIRHGRYKSAGEMFTRNASSEDNTMQYQALVNSMWSIIRRDIAAAREISEEALDSAIDNLELCLPSDFMTAHLADDLLSRRELKEKITALAVADKFEDVSFIPFQDYAAVKGLPAYKGKNKIAVIYADGEIIDGRGFTDVSGDRFAAIIDKVCADSSIKAVVLRVNSPGGSVLASEKIKNGLDELREYKPLIASYGGYAASGGYWISNNCDKIFTDATTLTGSIGVFGMVPDLSKTTKKVLGVNIQSFSSGKHGDMYSLMRPFDTAEYNYMLRSIETIYDLFTTTVSEGRGIPKETVDEVGQGRVWTGSDALGINLVDEIGTLHDAIDYAVLRVDGVSDEDVAIMEYPVPLTPLEQFKNMVGGSGSREDQFVKLLKKPAVVARMPYEITVF